MKATSRRKTKRREGKTPRHNSPQTARQAGASVAGLKKKIALLTRDVTEAREQQTATSRELKATSRELSEALEQQTATSEVLGIISSSPSELERVFETILANATRLCEASYGTLWLCEGDAFRTVALHGPLPTAFAEERRRAPVLNPGPGTGLAR